MMWEVWKDGKPFGLIETNYEYAVEYWKEREIQTGQKFELKEVFEDDPTTKAGIK